MRVLGYMLPLPRRAIFLSIYLSSIAGVGVSSVDIYRTLAFQVLSFLLAPWGTVFR